MAVTVFTIPHSLYPEKKIPAIGLGTWQAPPGEVEEAVYVALQQGFKHIDAASVYSNEREVGRGMKRWFDEGNNRDEIWVTSKLWNNSHRPDRVLPALEKTLSDLQLEYVDLYLIHWPCPLKAGETMIPRDDRPGREGQNMPIVENVTLNETWEAMEALLDTRKARNIGVSNFTRLELIEGIFSTAKHLPDVVQLELHPHLPQTEYRAWLRSQGILVQAYSPFGNLNPLYESKTGSEGRVIDQPVIIEVAKKNDLTPAQTVLSWGVSEGHCVLPKSTSAKRLKENLTVKKLSEEDLALIKSIGLNKRYNDMKGKFGYVTFQEEKDPETFASEIWSPEFVQADARKKTASTNGTNGTNGTH